MKIVSYYLHKEDFGSIKKTVVGKKSSALHSITVSEHIEEEQGQTLIREENAIGFSPAMSTSMDFSFSDSDSKEKGPEQDILSDQIKTDGLHFYYAHLEKTDGEKLKIVWKKEMQAGAALLGIRIELTFVPAQKNQEPLTLSRDVFLPSTALSKL